MTIRRRQTVPYTQVHDQIFDYLLAELSPTTFKVYCYFYRLTAGWHKEVDNVSISQLRQGVTKRNGEVLYKGTGLSKPTIYKCLTELEKEKLLIRQRRKHDDGGDAPTEYLLIIPDYDKYGRRLDNEGVKKIDTPPAKNLPGEGGKKFDPQKKTASPKKQQQTEPAALSKAVVVFLKKQGFSQSVAERLANGRSLAYVKQKVEYLAFEQSRKPDGIPNPNGWLRRAIEEDYAEPSSYKSQAERDKEAKAMQAQREQAKRAQQAFELAGQQAAKAATEQRQRQLAYYQREYQTNANDRAAWQKLKAHLKQSGNYSFALYALEGLKLDTRSGRVILGVQHQVALQKISEPSHKATLVADIERVLKISNPQLAFILMNEVEVNPQNRVG